VRCGLADRRPSERQSGKNHRDGLDSETITSVELRPVLASVALGKMVILAMTNLDLSEAVLWRARARQARRLAAMLSPRRLHVSGFIAHVFEPCLG
jgi:hypothetical protein